LPGRVLKPYRSGRDLELLEPLARRHTVYLECLQRAGLVYRRPNSSCSRITASCGPSSCRRPCRCHAFCQMSWPRPKRRRRCAAWKASRRRSAVSGAGSPSGRSGSDCMPRCTTSHSAMDGGVLFLDTFPPLIGYSREEMGRLLLRFSESGLMRGIGALLPGRVREIQDPWYGRAGQPQSPDRG
jgi:hypothetical protein